MELFILPLFSLFVTDVKMARSRRHKESYQVNSRQSRLVLHITDTMARVDTILFMAYLYDQLH